MLSSSHLFDISVRLSWCNSLNIKELENIILRGFNMLLYYKRIY
ncbi:hypothetical protein BCAH1134_C0178 (plasmid) [Bacillus cereus AH1134]|nr:hypothetical protein BCAH1134_C0178 [Bacillus cereus AH1134]